MSRGRTDLKRGAIANSSCTANAAGFVRTLAPVALRAEQFEQRRLRNGCVAVDRVAHGMAAGEAMMTTDRNAPMHHWRGRGETGWNHHG